MIKFVAKTFQKSPNLVTLVKWSACSPSTLTTRVQNHAGDTSIICAIKRSFKNDKMVQKEATVGQWFQYNIIAKVTHIFGRDISERNHHRRRERQNYSKPESWLLLLHFSRFNEMFSAKQIWQK